MVVKTYRALKLHTFAFSIVVIILNLFIVESCLAKRYIIPKDKDIVIKIKGENKKSLDPKSVKMLIWNLYKGDKPSWKSEYSRLTHDKDLLMLQEVYLDYQMSSVFYNDQYNYLLATSFLDTKNRNSPTGVAIASKVKASSYLWLRSKYREPIIKTPKMIIAAKFPLKGMSSQLMVITIHAINFVAAYKLQSMIDQIVNAAKNHVGPLVIAGDFNSWSKKKIKIVKNMASQLGLTNVDFRQNNDNDRDNDDRMSIFGNIIDYSFYRGGKLKKALVHGESDGSDHKAMEVEFDFR